MRDIRLLFGWLDANVDECEDGVIELSAADIKNGAHGARDLLNLRVAADEGLLDSVTPAAAEGAAFRITSRGYDFVNAVRARGRDITLDAMQQAVAGGTPLGVVVHDVSLSVPSNAHLSQLRDGALPPPREGSDLAW